MGVGAEGKGRPPQIRAKRRKFGQKISKKNGTKKTKKNCSTCIPGTAAACAGFREERFETWTVKIYFCY